VKLTVGTKAKAMKDRSGEIFRSVCVGLWEAAGWNARFWL